MNLHMKDNQWLSNYLIWFTALADELSKGQGKHQPLEDLQNAAQKINSHYWEHVQECSHEQKSTQKQNPLKTNPPPTTSSSILTSFQSWLSDPKPSKPKEPTKPTTPKVDLTGKLNSHGKLTQQEWQHQINKNLCMFCGGTGHQANNCPVKARSAKGWASTTVTELTPTKEKEFGTGKKKN